MYRFTFSWPRHYLKVSGQLHAPAALPPGKEPPPSTHWIGGWVDPRASLNNMEKWKFLTLLGLELRPLGHPACSQSLYRLCYPSSQMQHKVLKIIIQSHKIQLQKGLSYIIGWFSFCCRMFFSNISWKWLCKVELCCFYIIVIKYIVTWQNSLTRDIIHG
jgi:hypothetical protein